LFTVLKNTNKLYNATVIGRYRRFGIYRTEYDDVCKLILLCSVTEIAKRSERCVSGVITEWSS